MSSQTDLDQGGTNRQYQRIWLGPSVGWINYPVVSPLLISAAGTYLISPGTNLIRVNVAAGVVNIDLPSSKSSTASPQAIPGLSVYNPTIITDLSGDAGTATTINVFPLAPELIANLTEIQLAAAYATLLLEPLIDIGGWNLGQ